MRAGCRRGWLERLSWKGDSRAREKAEEDERLRWAGEVADLLLTLDTPTTQRANRAPDPKVAAMRMCGRVRAATLPQLRPGRGGPSGAGGPPQEKKQLPTNSEEVLIYLEQRAAEPCAAISAPETPRGTCLL